MFYPTCFETWWLTQSTLTLAISAAHSGDWSKALSISSCSLRLDDEAVRVVVGTNYVQLIPLT